MHYLEGFSLVLEYKNLSHSSISRYNAPELNVWLIWYSLTSEWKSAKIGAFAFEFEPFKSGYEKGISPFGFKRARGAHYGMGECQYIVGWGGCFIASSAVNAPHKSVDKFRKIHILRN